MIFAQYDLRAFFKINVNVDSNKLIYLDDRGEQEEETTYRISSRHINTDAVHFYSS